MFATGLRLNFSFIGGRTLSPPSSSFRFSQRRSCPTAAHFSLSSGTDGFAATFAAVSSLFLLLLPGGWPEREDNAPLLWPLPPTSSFCLN